MYGQSGHLNYSALRDRVLRLILFFNSKSKLLDKIIIFLFLFSSSIFLFGRFCSRPYGYFKPAVYFFAFFSRAISNTFLILYTEILFNLIRLSRLYFLYLYKSLSRFSNFFYKEMRTPHFVFRIYDLYNRYNV